MPVMKHVENEILVVWNNFQTGDKEAFAHLYNQYVEILYRYGTKLTNNHELVKDAIQEIFLELYVNRKNNNTDPTNLKYYLILALKRNIIKKIKRTRRNINAVTINESIFDPVYSIEKKIIDDELKREKNKRVVNALKQIPPKQKEALYLRYNEGLGYDEISGILNISKDSVRKQVYRALKKIKSGIDAKGFLYWMFSK